MGSARQWFWAHCVELLGGQRGKKLPGVVPCRRRCRPCSTRLRSLPGFPPLTPRRAESSVWVMPSTCSSEPAALAVWLSSAAAFCAAKAAWKVRVEAAVGCLAVAPTLARRDRRTHFPNVHSYASLRQILPSKCDLETAVRSQQKACRGHGVVSSALPAGIMREGGAGLISNPVCAE